MNNAYYVRSGLEATRNGITEPIVIVAGWLADIQPLLRKSGGSVGDMTDRDALELVALHGKLQRTQLGWIRDGQGEAILADVEHLWRGAAGPELACRALLVPNPEAWLEHAQTLYDSYEAPVDPQERLHLAEQLVRELDDADLAVLACQRLGVNDEGLDERLTPCHQWLADQADCFLAASVWVQAVGQTLRPDLSESDIELALTAEKYARILDAAEVAEAELSYRDVRPWSREVVEHLAAQAARQLGRTLSETPTAIAPTATLASHERSQQRRWRVRDVLPPPIQLSLAASAPELRDYRVRRLHWASPDGRYVAGLTIPERPQRGEDERLTIVVVRSDNDAEASELAGRTVQLGRAPRQTLNERGIAQFALGELRSGDELSLVIGDQEWWATEPER